MALRQWEGELRRFWRLILWVVAAMLLVMPLGVLTGPLLLSIVADAAVTVLLVRALMRTIAGRRAGAAAPGDAQIVWLTQRTTPKLRRHRPDRIVEMQIRWRRAAEDAEARRRQRRRWRNP